MKNLISISVLALMISLNAFGKEGTEGHGGFVVSCPGNSPQLLDYKEFSDNPQDYDLGTGLTIDQRMEHIFRKIERIDNFRGYLYRRYYRSFWDETLKANIKGLSFTSEQVSDPKVQESLHIGQTQIPKGCTLEQLAQQPERPDYRYVVYMKMWNQVSIEVQTAVILHEIVYREFLSIGITDSKRVRALVGLYSSSDFNRMQKEEYKKFMNQQGLVSVLPDISISYAEASTLECTEHSCTFSSSKEHIEGEFELCGHLYHGSIRPSKFKGHLLVPVLGEPNVKYYYKDETMRYFYHPTTGVFSNLTLLKEATSQLDLSCLLPKGMKLVVQSMGATEVQFGSGGEPWVSTKKSALLLEWSHPKVEVRGLVVVDLESVLERTILLQAQQFGEIWVTHGNKKISVYSVRVKVSDGAVFGYTYKDESTKQLDVAGNTVLVEFGTLQADEHAAREEYYYSLDKNNKTSQQNYLKLAEGVSIRLRGVYASSQSSQELVIYKEPKGDIFCVPWDEINPGKSKVAQSALSGFISSRRGLAFFDQNGTVLKIEATKAQIEAVCPRNVVNKF